MTRRLALSLSLAVAVALSGAPAARAQGAAPRFGRAVRSPEVAPDGRVTFRFRAPGAKQVVLAREGAAPALMRLDESGGVWSLTTDALAPDFYAYFFVVDGVALADPANPLAKPVAVGGAESLAHVPGPDSLPWEERDVPHGALHRHEYASAAVGERRAYVVYTPPGFDPASRERYPVLYLLHGVMEDETAWTAAGRANVILDNLIARGAAPPMIVVFPLGYGFGDVPDRVGDMLTGVADQRRVMDVFARTLVDEVVPRVERDYPVRRGPESRAVAGVSMGGAQALYVGLTRPDRFAWVGAFSPATIMFGADFDMFFPSLGGVRPRLVWSSVGADDFLLGSNRAFGAWLDAKGVRSTRTETPGDHAWTVWRRDLAAFAPLLFRGARGAR